MNTVCEAQSQEPIVPPGYGVGWNPPPVLDESAGIWSVSAFIGNGWAGRRLGLGEQSPLLCDAPPTQPGYCIRYPERLREVAPSRAQVSGPVDRVSAFPYCFKGDPWTEAGEGCQVVLNSNPCARLTTNLISLMASLYISEGSCGPT